MVGTKKAASKTAQTAAAKTAKPGAGKPAKKAAAAAIPMFGDIGKLLEKFKLPGLDIAAIVESQRKDMEALVEAHRHAYEGIKALAVRRNQILKEALAEWQAAMKDTSGKEASTKGAASGRKGVQEAIADIRELAEMEARSRKMAWQVLQDRFEENLANLKKLLQPK